MEKNRQYMENGLEDSAIRELQESPSRVYDTNDLANNVDNCSCPSCVCHKVKWLLPLAPGGIAAATPILVIAVAKG